MRQPSTHEMALASGRAPALPLNFIHPQGLIESFQGKFSLIFKGDLLSQAQISYDGGD